MEAARLRMRHSSSEVTKNHYFNEDAAALDVDHMYSPKEERQQHKLAAIKGGKMIKAKSSVKWIDIKLKLKKRVEN